MTTNRIEELQKRHTKELAQAEREEAIRALLPAGNPEPRYIHAHDLYGSTGAIKFEPERYGTSYTLREALDILDRFALVPTFTHRQHGCLVVCATDLADADATETWGPISAHLDQFGSKLQAYARLADDSLVEIEVLVGHRLGGYRPDKSPERTSYYKMLAVERLNSVCDRRVKWASGSNMGEHSGNRISYFWADADAAREALLALEPAAAESA